MKQEASEVAVLELLLGQVGDAEEGRVSTRQAAHVAIGVLTGFDLEGHPCIALDGQAEQAVPARCVVALDQSQLGRDVVLAFDQGDRRRPIVLGVLQPPQVKKPPDETASPSMGEVEAELDGERLELTAKREIVLRCGKASITLTRAGKVLIRGAYLLSRSSGANRIKGGSVQIN
jgi:hypothetical protein